MNDKLKSDRSRLCRKIAIGLFSVGVVAFCFRQPILSGVASHLVWQDASPENADVIVISGDGASRAALDWLATHQDSKLLLAEKQPPRVVQIGATVSDAERRRAISKAAGISEDRIRILVGMSMREIDVVQITDDWLVSNPGRSVVVFCDQFQSRNLRRAFDRKVDASLSSRVAIRPLAARRFSEADWWKSRLGVRAVFDAYLGLFRSWLGLKSPGPPPYLTPEQYEQAFLKSLAI